MTSNVKCDDTSVTIVPYFKVNEGQMDNFKALCEEFVALTKNEEKCQYYGFSFNGNIAHCRESYTDAEGLLAHLKNVDATLKKALEISQLERLEIHGLKQELDKLREPLASLNATYFELEYGFRN